MKILTNLLQALAIVALLLAVVLLVIDPRLRSLVVEDLSPVNPLANSSEGEAAAAQGSSQSGKAEQGSPTVTESGYTIASQCALWPVEGIGLYYSPSDPAAVCVQAPGGPIQAGHPLPSGVEMPLNCDIAPDSVVYCVVDGQLSEDTLTALYNRGELQTPREPEGDRG